MTDHKLPDQIERFKEQVLAADAGATFVIDTPAAETGFWWIDVDLADGLAICCWSQERGFGLYTDNDDDFGERPNELHRASEMAAARFLQIARDLRAGQSATLTLARLRELLGLNQSDLAAKLGVGQAAVSKLESRSEAQVGTLARAVRELGGELVLTVRFPAFQAELGLPDKDVTTGERGLAKTNLHGSNIRIRLKAFDSRVLDREIVEAVGGKHGTVRFFNRENIKTTKSKRALGSPELKPTPRPTKRT